MRKKKQPCAGCGHGKFAHEKQRGTCMFVGCACLSYETEPRREISNEEAEAMIARGIVPPLPPGDWLGLGTGEK